MKRARGMTLIEVLVALVILGIGVLGIAKLTLFSVRSNDSAYLRTQATALAYSVIDAMRSNRGVALTAAYDTALATAAANPGFNCAALATPCTPANLALYDVYMWKTRLNAALPGGALPSGAGSIVTATVNNRVTATITVQWDDIVAQTTFNKTAAGVAAPVQIVLETVL
jgi:type IV pilus assembly protein PilV